MPCIRFTRHGWRSAGLAVTTRANLYLHAGAGLAALASIDNPLGDDFAIQGGVMADWETRSLFAGYRSRYLDAGRFGDQFSHAARLGFAPYVGDTGDLHTWLMLEIDHRPEADDTVTAAPLIRLFKGPLLLEAGYNLSCQAAPIQLYLPLLMRET